MAKVTKKSDCKNVVSRKTLNTDRHIFSLLSTIQLLTLTDNEGNALHGQVLVVLDLEVQENLLLMLHRWQLRLLQKQRSFMVLKQ